MQDSDSASDRREFGRLHIVGGGRRGGRGMCVETLVGGGGGEVYTSTCVQVLSKHSKTAPSSRAAS